jgi:glycerol-3-phosphate dehydrogenase
VIYARDAEWARTVDDVVHRRTTVSVRGLDDPGVRERVDALMRGDVASAARG